MTPILLALVASLAACVVLAWAVGWLAAKPQHVACLVFCLCLLETANVPLAFQLGISLYPQDLFFIVLAMSCLLRFALATRARSVPLAWWVIGAVQLLLFVLGTRQFGTAAGVDWRGHFYLWVSVAYFCSVNWTEATIERVANSWIVFAALVCLIVYYRWARSAVDPGYAAQIMSLDTTGVRFRVVSADAALVIAVGLLLLLFKLMAGKLPPLPRLLLPFLPLTILVLQHRSVWASVVIGTACLIWLDRRTHKRKRSGTILALTLVPLVLFVAAAGGSSVMSSIKGSADQAMSTKEGTMVARVDNWSELIEKWADSHDPMVYLVGKPYGGGYNPIPVEDGTEFDMVPHDLLVHMLYRGGLIGVCATLYLFYRLWTGALRAAGEGRKRWAPAFVAILSAFFAFYIPYWATYVDGMLIGIAISYLRAAGRTHTLAFATGKNDQGPVGPHPYRRPA
ncbi:O-antigen ligase family protein [Massilia horti]|uniref:Uncharacterized protein n=1 Tax=Massilia horti TaxID=2562153 RepID=A0A4Y9T9P8_9BURK|nr:O-antigen ligase family protein [Massilia horti]TFW36314.1 hypothetical protein E4O92_00035 [Massilia horti]